MLHILFFSGTGTTKSIVSEIAMKLGGECEVHDLLHPLDHTIEILNPEDIIIIGAPVYAGRVPGIETERLKNVHGRGQKAIIVCVYGNRAYDDALVELCDIVASQGFTTIAAGAFIAEHCIFPSVAAGRPDAADIEKVREFARLCADRIAGKDRFDANSVKGNRPYLQPASVPLHPKADRGKCVECGLCVEECPVQAIDADRPYLTNNDICVSCCRCIHICPANARNFDGDIYNAAADKFTQAYERRKDPEWF